MAELPEIQRVSIPETGIHLLPLLTDPAILHIPEKPQLVHLEMTPVQDGKRTEARCRIFLLQADALKLLALLQKHAEESHWQIPEGVIVRRTVQ